MNEAQNTLVFQRGICPQDYRLLFKKGRGGARDSTRTCTHTQTHARTHVPLVGHQVRAAKQGRGVLSEVPCSQLFCTTPVRPWSQRTRDTEHPSSQVCRTSVTTQGAGWVSSVALTRHRAVSLLAWNLSPVALHRHRTAVALEGRNQRGSGHLHDVQSLVERQHLGEKDDELQ